MDLTTYVDNVRHELATTAGIDSEALAGRLAASLESALRLALLQALTEAANEITSQLAPGSVEVRLRGRDPSFVVALPPAAEPAEDNGTATDSAARAQALLHANDGPVVRTNLRWPEWLKLRAEEAAAQAEQSINAWLVQTVAAKLDRSLLDDRNGRRVSRDDRVTGWMR
jgi:hypothetical protein